jgi:hypothetical protein
MYFNSLNKTVRYNCHCHSLLQVGLKYSICEPGLMFLWKLWRIGNLPNTDYLDDVGTQYAERNFELNSPACYKIEAMIKS